MPSGLQCTKAPGTPPVCHCTWMACIDPGSVSTLRTAGVGSTVSFSWSFQARTWFYTTVRLCCLYGTPWCGYRRRLLGKGHERVLSSIPHARVIHGVRMHTFDLGWEATTAPRPALLYVRGSIQQQMSQSTQLLNQLNHVTITSRPCHINTSQRRHSTMTKAAVARDMYIPETTSNHETS